MNKFTFLKNCNRVRLTRSKCSNYTNDGTEITPTMLIFCSDPYPIDCSTDYVNICLEESGIIICVESLQVIPFIGNGFSKIPLKIVRKNLSRISSTKCCKVWNLWPGCMQYQMRGENASHWSTWNEGYGLCLRADSVWI